VEKEGVYGQGERRYQLIEKLLEPPGECRSDLQILVDLADRLGHGELIKARTPEQVWDEYRQFSASSYYNFAGMTRARLRKEHGLLWPCPTEAHPGTPRRYVEGVDPFVSPGTGMEFYGNPDKKAIIYLRSYVPSPEQPSKEYPLLLTTGRVLEQWHTGTMTGRIAELAKTSGLATIELNEQDAWTLKISAGDTVEVASKFGAVRCTASVTDGPRRRVVFASFWDVRLLINQVVADHVDAASKEPEYKVTAVRVRKVEV
jgi:nitrate reductase NapA